MNDKWNNNELQFARLLCELKAADFNFTDAATSMDLKVRDIEELFSRAESVFEAAKPVPPSPEPIEEQTTLDLHLALDISTGAV